MCVDGFSTIPHQDKSKVPLYLPGPPTDILLASSLCYLLILGYKGGKIESVLSSNPALCLQKQICLPAYCQQM